MYYHWICCKSCDHKVLYKVVKHARNLKNTLNVVSINLRVIVYMVPHLLACGLLIGIKKMSRWNSFGRLSTRGQTNRAYDLRLATFRIM